MSTITTLAHGKHFYLYEDLRHPGQVFIELDQPATFRADTHSVMLALPLALWEHLRVFTPADLTLVRKTDAQLRTLVEQRWRADVREYRAHPKPLSPHDPLRFRWSLLRRELRDPAHAIRQRFAALRRERAKQRRLFAAIQRLQRQAAHLTRRQSPHP